MAAFKTAVVRFGFEEEDIRMLTVTVTPDTGEPYELTADSRDVFVWEKTGAGRYFRSAMENASVAAMYEIAHIAARRQGLFSGSLNDFATTCQISGEPEKEDTEQGSDPFGLAASGVISSP